MKFIYIVLGFLSLALGIIGIFLPILPTTPFLLLTLFFFAKGSKRLEQWFLGTSIYQKHLKSFNENRSLKKNTNHATHWLLLYAKRGGEKYYCGINLH